MSDIKIKDGKVAVSDKEKYRQIATNTGNALSVPEILVKAFKEADLAFKWVSKAKIIRHGGHHPSSWIPYEISAEQEKAMPKTYVGNVVKGSLERGDLILAVKPREMQDAHKKDIQRRTKNQLTAVFEEKDSTGLTIMAVDE